jgi:hypothetical protein
MKCGAQHIDTQHNATRFSVDIMDVVYDEQGDQMIWKKSPNNF